MRVLLRISRSIDWFTDRCGQLATILTLLMVSVGIYNVFARFLGRYLGVNLTSNLFIELQWYLYSLVFFLAFSVILKQNENVRVDFFYANWDAHRQARWNLFGTVCYLFPFCLLVIYETITPVLNSWRVREMSPDPSGLPRYPLKTMIIVAAVLLFIQGISEMIKYIAFLRNDQQTPSGKPKSIEADSGGTGRRQDNPASVQELNSGSLPASVLPPSGQPSQ